MKRIILVEDDPALRNVYRDILEQIGQPCLVDAAANGGEAMTLFEKEPCHLIITDLGMPEVDGRRLYELVAQHCEARNADMPRFLFCSALSAALDRIAEICADGRNRQLEKPFLPDDMIDTVNEMLSTG
jgi:CheY-like chemotaxis protein